MIWHVVRFDFGSTPPTTRETIEAQLASLARIEAVAWLRVGRDLSNPDMTGLITVFHTVEDLEAYRSHPYHVPLATAIQESGIETVRLDLESADDASDMP